MFAPPVILSFKRTSRKIGAAHARVKTLDPEYFGLRMCEGFDRRPRRVSPGHPPGRNIAGWTLLRVDASARVAGKVALLGGGGYHRAPRRNARDDCAGGSKAMVARHLQRESPFVSS